MVFKWIPQQLTTQKQFVFCCRTCWYKRKEHNELVFPPKELDLLGGKNKKEEEK